MLILTAVISGLVSGFFASGGALVAVPMLSYQGLKPKTAQATAQSALVVVSVVTLATYLFRGAVEPVTLWSAAGAAAGGAAGARIRMSENARVWAFRLLSVWAGLRLIYG